MASKVKDGDFASLQFPWKLHALLEKCDDKEECSISWLPGGKSFQVHDKAIFATNVMPAYFKSAVYKSFQRNLNLWGWKTVSKEEGRAIYHHEHFVRGKPELCHNMVRGSVPPKVIVRPTEDSVSNTESGDPQVGDEVQPSNTAGLHNVSALPSFLQNSIEHVNSSREEADSGLAEAIKNASNSTLFGLLSPQLFQEAAGSFFAAETIMKSQLLLAQALSKRHDETLRAAASLGGTASFLNLGAATNNLPAGAPSLAGRYTPEGPAAVAIVANIASSSSSSAAPQQVPTSSQGPVRKRKFNPTLFAAGDHHASGEIVSPSTTEVYEPTYDVVPCRARAMPLDHNPHTAYFQINREKITHSKDLVCSHAACRKGGVKFRYCSFCKVPASKRTFSYFHAHRDQKEKEDDTVICEPLSKGSSQWTEAPTIVSNSSICADASSAVDQAPSVSPRRSPDDGENHSSSNVPNGSTAPTSARRKAWAQLLDQRPRKNSPDAALNSWVEQVWKVSDNNDDL